MKILKDTFIKDRLSKSGFTFIELVVAILAFSIGILGSIKMQTMAVEGNSFNMHLTDAITVAYNHMEHLSVLDYETSPDLQPGDQPNASTYVHRGIAYTLSRTVSTTGLGAGVDLRDLSVTVNWLEKTIPHSITVTTRKAQD